MTYDIYLRFVLALLLVLGLIAILAWALRRFGFGGVLQISRSRRIQLIEACTLGPRHRLVLIRRDNMEHLLLLSPQGDQVIERGIETLSFHHEVMQTEIPPASPKNGLTKDSPSFHSTNVTP